MLHYISMASDKHVPHRFEAFLANFLVFIMRASDCLGLAASEKESYETEEDNKAED